MSFLLPTALAHFRRWQPQISQTVQQMNIGMTNFKHSSACVIL